MTSGPKKIKKIITVREGDNNEDEDRKPKDEGTGYGTIATYAIITWYTCSPPPSLPHAALSLLGNHLRQKNDPPWRAACSTVGVMAVVLSVIVVVVVVVVE